MPIFRARFAAATCYTTRRGDHVTDRTVARLNIAHFCALLAAETDETRRETTMRLLAEEEAKLKTLTRQMNQLRQTA